MSYDNFKHRYENLNENMIKVKFICRLHLNSHKFLMQTLGKNKTSRND